MKKLLIFFVAIMVLFTTSCKKTKEVRNEKGELVERYQYTEDNNGSFIKNGKYQSWYSNGIIEKNGAYKNNKKQGLWKHYDKKGNIKDEIVYDGGLKHGKALSYHENGVISNSRWFSRDTLHGEFKTFYSNSAEEVSSNYVYGKLDKEYVLRDSLGLVLAVENYEKGVKVGKWTLYKNGQIIREFNFVDGYPIEILGDWQVVNMRKTTYSFGKDGRCTHIAPHWKAGFFSDPLNEYNLFFDSGIQDIKLFTQGSDNKFQWFVIEKYETNRMDLFDLVSKQKYILEKIEN